MYLSTIVGFIHRTRIRMASQGMRATARTPTYFIYNKTIIPSLRPYINIEDLVKGKTLLLFLNSRGRHPPSIFGPVDSHAMRLGTVSTAVLPAFLNLYTMLLEGKTARTCGRLVSRDDDDDAMMKALSGFGGYQLGEGLLIL